MNTLYYGDNLRILRDTNYFPDEFIDLCYLDASKSDKQIEMF